jgi:hypothetical protein
MSEISVLADGLSAYNKRLRHSALASQQEDLLVFPDLVAKRLQSLLDVAHEFLMPALAVVDHAEAAVTKAARSTD